MDGLYWRFVHKNKSFFAKNPRMSMMAKMLDKMDVDRKKKIFKRADEFIKEFTQ
jgi:deoxyribodipyrimidine photolyase-related protein